MTFESLGLSEPLLRAVKQSGYTIPTPIQTQAIPAILDGSDVMAAAQTGTGKTAGFTLPLLQRLSNGARPKSRQARALVLTPTRELAAQVQESVMTYGKYLQLSTAVVFGGVNMRQQINKMQRGVDVLVATPGRLLDLYRQGAIRLDDVEILVLDEADRMLDMGFIHDIKTIMGMMPKQRQNLMFSATFSNAIRQLAKSITNNPLEIDVAPRNATVAGIVQTVHPVDKARKSELLSRLIRTENWFQVLVFSRTRHGADKLVKKLARDNIRADAIHGDKSQGQRTRVMKNFKQNKTQVLVATDIAARGIDIDALSHVVNFDMPHVAEDYVHRIGRTGRAGASGSAISLVSADETRMLLDIEKLIQQKIAREEIEGFEPVHAVPEFMKPVRANNQRPQKNGKKPGGHRKGNNNGNARGNGGNEPRANSKSRKPKHAGKRNHQAGTASRQQARRAVATA